MANRKKRRRLRKAPIFILLCIIVIITILIIKSCRNLDVSENSSVQANNSSGQSDSSLVGWGQTSSKSVDEDSLESATSLTNFVPANADRYRAYKAINSGLPYTDVVLKVNIGLDNEFYTNDTAIQNPDDLLVLCNKYHYLSSTYIPHDLVNVDSQYMGRTTSTKLRKEANNALNELGTAASKEGLSIKITTSFRDYAWQNSLYTNYVNTDGKAAADTYSARAGYSEHQTGLAMDLGGVSPKGGYDLNYFENTAEFNWMLVHAHEYGFVLRFPKDKVDITGYQYEAWHYRYVGKEVAKTMHDEGLCLEEYWAKYLTNKVD
ncbi:MAG: M15 family metallopeptidase [Oscillospiraceae bacterium]|nr:M15 family metallopeptidase [Oscillospiraceae bacterium]